MVCCCGAFIADVYYLCTFLPGSYHGSFSSWYEVLFPVACSLIGTYSIINDFFWWEIIDKNDFVNRNIVTGTLSFCIIGVVFEFLRGLMLGFNVFVNSLNRGGADWDDANKGRMQINNAFSIITGLIHNLPMVGLTAIAQIQLGQEPTTSYYLQMFSSVLMVLVTLVYVLVDMGLSKIASNQKARRVKFLLCGIIVREFYFQVVVVTMAQAYHDMSLYGDYIPEKSIEIIPNIFGFFLRRCWLFTYCPWKASKIGVSSSNFNADIELGALCDSTVVKGDNQLQQSASNADIESGVASGVTVTAATYDNQ